MPETINPVKLARMRAFGARVTLAGRDTVTADDAAREHAAAAGDRVIVEDGRQAEIAEGAGTIGVELLDAGPFDAIVVPVGDGALIAGIALWVKAHAPSTRIVGVCATGAPSLAESWRARRPVSTSSSNTIAEGLDICVPVPESVARVVELVDDMVLVDDADLLRAMRLSLDTIGVVLEPSGAAGLAAIQKQLVAGERVAHVAARRGAARVRERKAALDASVRRLAADGQPERGLRSRRLAADASELRRRCQRGRDDPGR